MILGCPPNIRFIISSHAYLEAAGKRRASGGQAAGKRRASGGQAAAIIIIIACDNIKMIIANIRRWLTRLRPEGNHGTKLIRAPPWGQTGAAGGRLLRGTMAAR